MDYTRDYERATSVRRERLKLAKEERDNRIYHQWSQAYHYVRITGTTGALFFVWFTGVGFGLIVHYFWPYILASLRFPAPK